jgi:hypothetical protein
VSVNHSSCQMSLLRIGKISLVPRMPGDRNGAMRRDPLLDGMRCVTPPNQSVFSQTEGLEVSIQDLKQIG